MRVKWNRTLDVGPLRLIEKSSETELLAADKNGNTSEATTEAAFTRKWTTSTLPRQPKTEKKGGFFQFFRRRRNSTPEEPAAVDLAAIATDEKPIQNDGKQKCAYHTSMLGPQRPEDKPGRNRRQAATDEILQENRRSSDDNLADVPVGQLKKSFTIGGHYKLKSESLRAKFRSKKKDCRLVHFQNILEDGETIEDSKCKQGVKGRPHTWYVVSGSSSDVNDVSSVRKLSDEDSAVADVWAEEKSVEYVPKEILPENRPTVKPDASQPKPPKPTSRTPAISSRVAQSKIEELSVEVQRLGALCEQRTKELNMVKMQLKHTYCGFDAFAIMVNYLVGELDAFSHPQLLADMQKTREQLACSQKLLGQYENELDYLKKQHSAEVQELANELSRTNGEVTSLTSQMLVAESSHEIKMEEMERFRVQEIQQISSEHLSLLENMHQTHKQHTQDLESVHLRTLEETKRLHEVAISELLQQLEELKEKSDHLELQSKQFEETLQKDTDSKIQWIYSKNAKLIAEVDSLKSVMEMKQAEIHSLRKDNLELRKELEELPLAQKQIENLRARNEDLQAMIREKSKSARKLCQEKRQIKDICERVHKDNRRISMENEELQWKLQQTLDGSWSLCSMSPDHDSHRRDNTTLLSPSLSPWHEMEEDRLLPTSPINFYTLPVGLRSPQSASSSPGKSPTRPPSKTRQRHRSLGQPVTPTEVPCPSDMSESMREPELYFKACLQYEEDEALDQLFQASSVSPKDTDRGDPLVYEQNLTHSSDSSMTSSLGEGSSLSSGEADQRPNEQNVDTNFDLCSPRNLAGEAMVQDQNPSPASSTSPVATDSIFNKSTMTKRTPESETLPTLPNHVETPSVEVSSHGLPPTDSTNMDSSYGDDLGLESE